LHTSTYNTLLGLGFDTDLIRKIDLSEHTVEALRSLSSKALAAHYDESEVQLIRERIRRSAIPTQTVDAVLESSDGVCCFCGDGISSRPFQIHHAVEYSKTQDHSLDNLILLCPNHHQTIPKKLSAEEQKRVRNEWWVIVSLVRAYRLKGISFPFGSFTALDYTSQPDPVTLIEGFRPSNATAFDMAQNPFAGRACQRLRKSPFLAIAGKSGSGKSTFARGIAGHFRSLGYQAFLFQAPKANAVGEVLTFLSTADRDCILLLDDVNLYLTESDLATVQAACRSEALVICTWTREAVEAASLERHLPDWLLIDWEQLRPGVHEYLLRHEIVLAPAIGKRQGKDVIGRVGLGHMDERLKTYLNQFESKAKSVSEFLFLVRGGEEIVARELDVLIDAGRSDIPVLYAALEQIAGFERMVTVQEVVMKGNSLFEISETAPMTGVWVTEVFRSQVARGRMQEARGHFTTIHRDWAARLLNRALASERISGDADRLLSPVFNFSESDPERLMRLWSWFWYLPTAGKWERKILAAKSADDWTTLVGRAAAHSLSILCSVAGRMHLLFQHPGWTTIVASAFEHHEAQIRSLLTTATPTDWPSLKLLAWTVGYAKPSLASRIWSGLNPSATAALIESTHPDYYRFLSWFLHSAKEHSPAWITEVGRALDVDLMLKRLQDISQGDAETAFIAMEILRMLGVPIRRSTIRRIAEAFGEALRECPLGSIHVGFPPFWDPTWLVFSDDLQKSLASIDGAVLARELSVASPREWRVYCDLTMFAVPAVANLERKIIDQVDPAVLAQTVARTAEGHEYELRCLLWSLSRGTGPVRGEIARLLYDTVLQACRRSEQERFELLKALYAVDHAQGTRLQAELASFGPPRISDDERKETKLDKRDREQVWKDATRLKEQYAEAEQSGEDYVFEAWPRDHEMDS
jgi:energy-coupling factor transporter ATP-binding protein EcfA2